MSAEKPTMLSAIKQNMLTADSATTAPISNGNTKMSGTSKNPTGNNINAKKMNFKTTTKEVRFSKNVDATVIQSRKDSRRRGAGIPVIEEIQAGYKMKIRLTKPSQRSRPYGPPVDGGVPGVSKKDVANADNIYANLSIGSDNRTIRSTDGETSLIAINHPLVPIIKPLNINNGQKRGRIPRKRQVQEEDANLLLHFAHSQVKKRKECIPMNDGCADENWPAITEVDQGSIIGMEMGEEPALFEIEDPAIAADESVHAAPVISLTRGSGAVLDWDDTASANDVMTSKQSLKINEDAHGGKKTTAVGEDMDMDLDAPALNKVVAATFTSLAEDRQSVIASPRTNAYGPIFKHSINIDQHNWSSSHQMVVQGLIDVADFGCLRRGARDERLTDNCVYFGLLQAASLSNQNVSVFAPQLYTQWRRSQQQPNGNDAFTKEQILEFAYVKEHNNERKLEDFLMPLHRDNGTNTASSDAHWSLAYFDSEKSTVVIYDSLKSTSKNIKERTMEDIKEIMKRLVTPEAYRRLKVRYCFSNHVEYQKGGISCGIHVIVNARRLMEGRRSLINKIGETINQRKERDYLHAVMTSVKQDLDQAAFVFAQNVADVPPQVPGPLLALNQRSRRDHSDTIRKIRRCLDYYRRR